uniref:Uncharacterized protein n=1 Tax=Arundo donax TaxID=35708 RepID=A0A0A9FS71_ARUDO
MLFPQDVNRHSTISFKLANLSLCCNARDTCR